MEPAAFLGESSAHEWDEGRAHRLRSCDVLYNAKHFVSIAMARCRELSGGRRVGEEIGNKKGLELTGSSPRQLTCRERVSVRRRGRSDLRSSLCSMRPRSPLRISP